MITAEEAQALGSDAFSLVARTREENLKRENIGLREAITRAKREADKEANRVARERGKRNGRQKQRGKLSRGRWLKLRRQIARL